MTNRTMNPLLSEKEAARLLNVTPSWLQKGRCNGSYGPNYVKMNGAIRYLPEDIVAFLSQHRVRLNENSTEGEVQ